MPPELFAYSSKLSNPHTPHPVTVSLSPRPPRLLELMRICRQASSLRGAVPCPKPTVDAPGWIAATPQPKLLVRTRKPATSAPFSSLSPLLPHRANVRHPAEVRDACTRFGQRKSVKGERGGGKALLERTSLDQARSPFQRCTRYSTMTADPPSFSSPEPPSYPSYNRRTRSLQHASSPACLASLGVLLFRSWTPCFPARVR